MYNYFMLIGIISRDIEIKTSKNGSKYTIVTLCVTRPFKNVNGEYDADFLDIFVWESLSEIVFENLKKGSKVGIKGRIQSRVVKEDDKNKNTYTLIGDRIIFFEPKNSNKEENFDEMNVSDEIIEEIEENE